MPGESGSALPSEPAEAGAQPGASSEEGKYVYISATREEVLWQELGAAAFIRKPFDTEELLVEIRSLVKR